MPTRFLYFDLGNVLLSFSHERMCQQMAAVAGIDAEAVRRALFDGPAGETLQWRFERGDFDAAAAYEHFCTAAGVRPDRATLHAAACDIFEELPESVALVQRLAKANNRLGILSNTNPVDFESLCREHSFLRDCFELRVASYEARHMKPHREIYDHAVRLTGLRAAEVFFADDKPENVAGAVAAGMDAVLFTNVPQLETDLRQRGVNW